MMRMACASIAMLACQTVLQRRRREVGVALEARLRGRWGQSARLRSGLRRVMADEVELFPHARTALLLMCSDIVFVTKARIPYLRRAIRSARTDAEAHAELAQALAADGASVRAVKRHCQIALKNVAKSDIPDMVLSAVLDAARITGGLAYVERAARRALSKLDGLAKLDAPG